MEITYQELSGQGERENNEDYCLSLPVYNIFIVCDGVGGSNKGEIASRLACESFGTFLSGKNGEVSEENILEALHFTEKQFDGYTGQNPESKGMATTFTLLKVFEDRAILAHCGDSRIYHIRNGEILFQTYDHSYVNELVASGYITPEEAKTHPKKNQITRAIRGTENATMVDVNFSTEIKVNDFFMLCSDGILESLDEHFIAAHFKMNNEVNMIINEIENACKENSQDNFTAIVLKVIS